MARREERRLFKIGTPVRCEQTEQHFQCDKCHRRETVGRGDGFTYLAERGWELRKGVIYCPACKRQWRRNDYLIIAPDPSRTDVPAGTYRVILIGEEEFIGINKDEEIHKIGLNSIIGRKKEPFKKRRKRRSA